MKRIILAVTMIGLAAPVAAQELRIGYLNTMTGGGAVIGVEMTKAFKLGLEHQGWMKDGDPLGGVPTRIFWGDDQQRPDVGVKEVERFIKGERVQLVAGIVWSNVLMAVQKFVTDSKVGLLSLNAGASPMAGELCSPYYVSTSFNNDQFTEGLGKLISDEAVQSIWLMAPNYQAGKDLIAGLKRTLKGPRIVGETLFKLGETDFQSDISKVRAAKPTALFVFASGAMAPAFMKQWAASGAGRDIRLFTSNTVDWLSLPAIGDAAVGSFQVLNWNIDLDYPASRRFVRDYVARHGQNPSNYAAQAYDGAQLIAAAARTLGGKVENSLSIVKTMRKTRFDSVRGSLSFNVNGFPIQNFYKQEIVKGTDGKAQIVTRGVVFANYKDSYWEKCPSDRRH